MAGDPWVIQPHEHGKFAEHFRNLNPVNGLVTGEQAKRFMLQSQLPPPILGQIWVLSDTNADGKLDLKEFSIACKIINLKLHGVEIPKVLPSSLLSSLSPGAAGGAGAGAQLYSQPQRPAIPPLPNVSQTSAGSPLIPGVQPIVTANTSNQSLIGDLVSSQPLIPGMQPMIPSSSMSLPRKPSLTNQNMSSNNQTLISGLATSQPLIPNQPLMANTVSQPMFSQSPLIPPMSISSQPMSSVSSTLVGGIEPLIPGGISQPLMAGTLPSIGSSQSMMGASQPLMAGTQPLMAGTQSLMAGTQPLMAGTQPLMGSSQPMMPGSLIGAPQSNISQSIMSGPQNLINTSQPLISGSSGFASGQPLVQSPPNVMANIGNISSASTMMSSGQPVTSTPIATSGQSKMQTMDDILNPGIQSPSQDVPLGTMAPGAPEWGLPQAQRLKYGQLFNTTDHTKAGWVSGPQARSIMLQSRLPQATLAQIWALADIDRDGKLGCEEFVLAMYLCEIATKGETIPLKLPPELIPPAFRRESIGSGGSQSSLEERRRENFVRGQAELERRRAALANAQTKEKEAEAERERKEREEAEKREKIRLEIQKKEQEELQRKQKEEQEKRDAARKEMERQCQLEWEMKRTRELELMRSEEQSKVLALKAKSQQLTGELALVNTRAANLAKDIRDTRTNVAQVKSTIDGMRSSRDSSMQEMSQLKTKVKELNAKQITLNQEKAQLDAKAKASEGAGEDGKLNMLEVTLKQLREKVETAKSIVEAKRHDVETNDQQLATLTSTVAQLSDKCQRVWQLYEEKRQQYEEMRSTAPAEPAWDTAANWDTGAAAPESDWGSNAVDVAWPQSEISMQEPAASLDGGGEPRRFRCVYEFSSRTKDELPLQPGDVVTDAPPPRADADEGWRWGQCRGQLGWYPESYVEEIAPGAATTVVMDAMESKTPLEGIAEVPENVNDVAPVEIQLVAASSPPATTSLDSEYYVAAYSYNSMEPGDLTFEAGEVIHVVGKDGDWWTGQIGTTRTGIFPSNYVQKTENVTAAFTSSTAITQPDVLSQTIPEEVVETVKTEIVPQISQQEPKSTTPISSEVASITESAEQREKFGSNGSGTGRPQSVTRRDSGRDSITGMAKKKMEVAQALAAFTANSAEQLSLQKGQLVLVRKKADSGWWEGELQAKGRNKQVGWFPASYVKLLQSSGRTSGRTTPVMSSKVDNFPQEQVIDKVIALYPYTAQNADELSFEKDDIIAVTNRDQDPAWWQGELRGMTGLFPSNYVTKLVHDN